MKRVALECGGKSPHVVMADADIEAAAEAIAWGIYYNQGETCHAGSRVLAHSSIRAELIAAIGEAQRTQIPLGHPFEASAQLGAVVEERHMQRVLSLYRTRRRRRARRRAGRQARDPETGGFYIEPTVLDNARNDMRIAQEEIFGPVRRRHSLRDEAEAMRLANDTIYGLGAGGVDARHERRAPAFPRDPRRHGVGQHFDRSSLATPFGGFKQSGFGRDRSPHAIDKYTDFKTIWTAYK